MADAKEKVVVLGAGPAGISAAHRFASDGFDVTLIEKRDHVGGLGATFKWDQFYLDFGPHAFHPKPSVVMDNFKKILGDNYNLLLFQDRNERLLLRNKLFQYPLQLWELVLRLNPFVTLKLGFDFIMASLIYRFIAVPDDNFESWCIKRFGKSLYQLCFGNYTSKVWGISPTKISPKFARQKIHKLSLKDIIKKLFGGRGEEQENYWNDLFYPKLGAGQLYDLYAEYLKKIGVRIVTGAEVTELTTSETRISAVKVKTAKGEETFKADRVISTIPVMYLVKSLGARLSDYARYKAGLLKFRSLVLVFVEFLQPDASGVHWIYLLDTKYKSNRYTEQKNMSADTCPPDRTVLCFEKSCQFKDDVWNADDATLFGQIMNDDIVPNPHLDHSKVGRYHISRIRHAYPVYDHGFEHNLRVVLDNLARIENLYSVGRQGLFLQNDQHGSMIMGWEIGDYAGKKPQHPWKWYQKILARWDLD